MLKLAAGAAAIDQEGHRSTQRAVHFLEPITSLLPLMRVDQTFKNTLEGSPKLQRAMFSQPHFLTVTMQENRFAALSNLRGEHLLSAMDALPLLPHIPLVWLEHKVDLRANSISFTGATGEMKIDASCKKLPKYRKKYKGLMASSFGNANASWRRIEVFQSEIDEERLQAVRVQYFPPPHRAPQGDDIYYENLAFPDGITLGEVFEKIAEIIWRPQDDHLVAARTAEAVMRYGEGATRGRRQRRRRH